MTREIEVADKSRIYVGCADELLQRLLHAKRVILLTDEHVAACHAQLIEPYESIVIAPGEASKSLAEVERIYLRLVEMGADRTTFILGVGGGVVTDIAGFVASTYMRGVEFGFVTTSLLGAADASVGGKNGVNLGGFKNMVGTFSQPRFVVCDARLLSTLPDREFRAGLAEVIKSAILGDAGLFALLERASFEALRTDSTLLEEVLLRTIRIKASVVTQDEREGGLRRTLNLGHTLAHAIEKCTRTVNHGEAVAVGLHHITRTSLVQGLIADGDAERIFALLRHYGFSTELPAPHDELCRAVRGDKKRSGHTIHLILPTAIGAVIDREVELDNIHDIL
ncbi:MAG: 3-dehydroquinate synthase [Alistipes sp.]|nr:3-dehydroquinate synthase [Alistipes sp.]